MAVHSTYYIETTGQEATGDCALIDHIQRESF